MRHEEYRILEAVRSQVRLLFLWSYIKILCSASKVEVLF